MSDHTGREGCLILLFLMMLDSGPLMVLSQCSRNNCLFPLPIGVRGELSQWVLGRGIHGLFETSIRSFQSKPLCAIHRPRKHWEGKSKFVSKCKLCVSPCSSQLCHLFWFILVKETFWPQTVWILISKSNLKLFSECSRDSGQRAVSFLLHAHNLRWVELYTLVYSFSFWSDNTLGL